MSYSDYLLRYRTYPTDDLNAEIASLRKQDSVLSSQTAGSKSLTRDLRSLNDKLTACAYVLRERGLPWGVNNSIGTTDFSNVQGTGGLAGGNWN